MPGQSFTLTPLPPFRLDLTVWALRRRPDNIIDRWDGGTYRRVLVVNGHTAEVGVSQIGPAGSPQLQVEVASHSGLNATNWEAKLKASLEQLLGLRQDLSGFYRLAEKDPKLAPLVRRFRGLKPPRFPTVFEAVVNGIACQQLSLTLGIVLLNRLAEAYGHSFGALVHTAYAFPRPQDVAGRSEDDLRQLGFSHAKARSILELSNAIINGETDLEAEDNQAALASLLRLRGVGRWTAEYVLLRGLGRYDMFPGDDVGARNNLREWLGLEQRLDYEGIRSITANWKPYSGLVYFHLLLNRLAERGLVR